VLPALLAHVEVRERQGRKGFLVLLDPKDRKALWAYPAPPALSELQERRGLPEAQAQPALVLPDLPGAPAQRALASQVQRDQQASQVPQDQQALQVPQGQLVLADQRVQQVLALPERLGQQV
jgi:hypothetical protein